MILAVDLVRHSPGCPDTPPAVRLLVDGIATFELPQFVTTCGPSLRKQSINRVVEFPHPNIVENRSIALENIETCRRRIWPVRSISPRFPSRLLDPAREPKRAR